MNKKENLVDILLTYEWPSNIENGSQKAKTLNINNTTGQSTITTLNKSLSPRYHFASSENTFFEREPFKNEAEHHTRFIGLSSFGNSKKERVIKFLYLIFYERIQFLYLKCHLYVFL